MISPNGKEGYIGKDTHSSPEILEAIKRGAHSLHAMPTPWFYRLYLAIKKIFRNSLLWILEKKRNKLRCLHIRPRKKITYAGN